MATGAELIQRPMPEANVPPDTAPREPPVPLDGEPVVTAVEQVIPIHLVSPLLSFLRLGLLPEDLC